MRSALTEPEVRSSVRRLTQPFRADRPAVAELAAGAILANEEADELLLLHHLAEDRWCFPKGHVESNEALIDAAVREITEETGVKEFTLVQELGEAAYRFFDPEKKVNVFKTTVYFIAYTPDREAPPEEIFDKSLWLKPRDAYDLVAYDTDRRMIEAAQSHLSAHTVTHKHYG